MLSIWDEEEPDPKDKYRIDQFIGARCLTKLMILVLHPETNNNIDKFREFVLKCTKEYINRQNSKGWSAIHVLCRNSKNMNLEILQILIDAGANIDLQENEGWTALMLSSGYSGVTSTENTVKKLVDEGANLNLRSKSGMTALMIASRYSNVTSTENTVKILVDAKAKLDLQEKIGWTALMCSTRTSGIHSTENTMKILIEAKADLNLREKYGLTALMIASKYSNINRNISNSVGTTMYVRTTFDLQRIDAWENLVGMSKFGGGEIKSINTINILINAGANLDLQDNKGWTALMHVFRYGKKIGTIDVVKTMVDAKANINLQDKRGWPVLLHAFRYGKFRYINNDVQNIIKMLIEAGANPNVIGYYDKTCIDVEYFLDNGYSLYHPSLLNMSTNKYNQMIEPRKKRIIARSALLKMELPEHCKYIRFKPGSKGDRMTYLMSNLSNISEEELMESLKKDGIWDFLSIRDEEDMYRKISDYIKDRD